MQEDQKNFLQRLGDATGAYFTESSRQWGEIFSWLGDAAHKNYVNMTTQFGQLFSWLGDAVHKNYVNMTTQFGDLFSWIGTKTHDFVGLIGGAFSALGSTIAGIWNSIVGTIRNAINAIIGLVNGFIGGLDSLNINIGPIHVQPNIPKIPSLASGIENFAGGIAYVHKDEMLVNMPKGTSVIPANQAAGLGSPHITVQPPPIYLDGRLLAQGLLPYVTDAIRIGTGGYGI